MLILPEPEVEITVVTNGLEDVTGNEQLHPEKSLLLGPCKVIPQEYSHLDCRIIDIELPMPREPKSRRPGVGQADYWRNLKRNLFPPLLPIGVRTAGFSASTPYIVPAPSALLSGKSGVYFITGGLGGVGLTLAEHLAKTRERKTRAAGSFPDSLARTLVEAAVGYR